jgi:hypothetical protein
VYAHKQKIKKTTGASKRFLYSSLEAWISFGISCQPGIYFNHLESNFLFNTDFLISIALTTTCTCIIRTKGKIGKRIKAGSRLLPKINS